MPMYRYYFSALIFVCLTTYLQIKQQQVFPFLVLASESQGSEWLQVENQLVNFHFIYSTPAKQ